MHTLKTVTVINRPIEEVFAFFSEAQNLDLLTPDSLAFRITTPLPVHMQKGTLIDYRLRLNGIPFRWRTLISAWEPPFLFIDEQVKGPYVKWHHTHAFKDLGNGTTEMTDTVLFRSPGWVLEPLIHHLFVRKKVEQIFSFRSQRLKELFPS